MMLAPELGPAGWKGKEIDAAEDLHYLSDAELDEIAVALRGVGDLDLPEITAARFPLPTLGSRLAQLGETLRLGRGFVLLRGLTRERFRPGRHGAGVVRPRRPYRRAATAIMAR